GKDQPRQVDGDLEPEQPEKRNAFGEHGRTSKIRRPYLAAWRERRPAATTKDTRYPEARHAPVCAAFGRRGLASLGRDASRKPDY
ncbi:MAG: hypothetical protein R3322_23385, partial [Kiloniellales bacterium]|nr:hypothetical protein [Kiloniellales bacterium]